MRLQEIMHPEVFTIEPTASADEALGFMDIQEVHHLVVLHGKDIVGILSRHDLENHQKCLACEGGLVMDYMSTDIITANTRTTIKEAANILRGHRIGCLPVLDHHKLVGIVTISDLLELLGRGYDRTVELPKRQIGVDMPSYLRTS